MLQLLLERGQSYSDLADILGVDAGEVRTRARAALTELAGADPDRNVGLTDYILGQADPIDRADAVRHLKDDPDDFELVRELAQKLRLVAPEAELPRLPGEERQPRPRRAPRERTSRTSLTRRQTQGLVGLGSAAVLIIVGVLAIAGVFNGSSSASDSTTASDGTASTTTTPSTQNLTRVPLNAVGGSGASGTTVFGIANGSQPFVDVKLQGLKPLPGKQTYVIWLLLTPDQGYPLSPIGACDAGAKPPCISKDGSFANRFVIPSAILPVITKVQLVDVSFAPTQTVVTAVESALKNKKVVIKRPGTSVLQGAIPKASAPAG
jgi:hypothetical protein